MTLENFLPLSLWNANPKDLIKDPKYIAILGGSLLLPGIGLLFWPLIWIKLINYFLDEQRDRRIKAIQEAFPNKYSYDELNNLHNNNRQEFNRLFKLSADEFFRKYIAEQADHKKAQQIIIELQSKIEEMRLRLEYMEQKEDKHREEINMLKEEMRIYDEILTNWKRKAA